MNKLKSLMTAICMAVIAVGALYEPGITGDIIVTILTVLAVLRAEGEKLRNEEDTK